MAPATPGRRAARPEIFQPSESSRGLGELEASINRICRSHHRGQLLHSHTYTNGRIQSLRPTFAAMSDFGSYGGSEEEYAAVRKQNALVVRPAI